MSTTDPGFVSSSLEVDRVVQLCKSGFAGWSLAHFHSKYKAEFKGQRSYSWLKTVLRGAGVVKACKRRGKHRIKRERAPLAGMMLHQDASIHRWVPGAVWDLVVTLEDATGEHTSMFFCHKEGTDSSFHDNCVSFEGLSLQIPADEFRYHYVHIRVRVHRYYDATLALFHGPRKLACFDACGIALKALEVPRLAA